MSRTIGIGRAFVKAYNGYPIRANRSLNTNRAMQFFTPDSLTGIAVWLDAMDAGTVVSNAAGTITGWINKAGLGETATVLGTAPVYAPNVINGRNAINFFPVTIGAFSIADATAYNYSALNVFVVAQRVTVTGGTESMVSKWLTTGNQREFAVNFTSGNTVQGISSADGGSTTVGAGTSGTVAVGTPIIVEYRWSGTQTQTFRNNANSSGAQAATIFNGTANINIGAANAGANQGFRGYIGEVIICTSQLGTTERNNTLAYLSQKWGITVA